MAIAGRRPTLTDCGCEATVYADGSGIELHYCPLHQAAKQMLEAARGIDDYFADPEVTNWWIKEWPGLMSAILPLFAAIKAAGG